MTRGSMMCIINQFEHIFEPGFRFGQRYLAIGIVLIFTIVGSGLWLACSDSGSGGGASALTLPSRISLTNVDDVDAAESASLDGVSGLMFDHPSIYDLAVTDYSEEPKDIWVDDTDAVDLVNDILGVVSDSAYAVFLNAGPYKALVRKVDDEVETQSGSTSTSAATESLMEITVNVTRQDNDSPMIIKVWVDETGDEPGQPDQRIRGYFQVFQSVSDTYPLGQLEAHFRADLLDEDGEEIVGDPVFTLALKVDADQHGNVIVESVDIGQIDPPGPDEEEWDNRLRLIANSDMSEGKAYYSAYEYWTNGVDEEEEDDEGYIAYNQNFFKEKVDGELEEVYDKNNLYYKAFRYKLFEHDTGDRVERNSGFPIRLEDGYYGYIGYYGLWVENGIEVLNGDTVYDLDSNPYEVFKVGGNLRRHTKSSITLGQLAGQEMSHWQCGGGALSPRLHSRNPNVST